MVTSAIFWEAMAGSMQRSQLRLHRAWAGAMTHACHSVSPSQILSYFSLPALLFHSPHLKGFRWLNGKEFTHQRRRRRFNPWVGKIPWRRKWQPTPVSLPGKSRGQRSLAGCSPWGHRGVRHDLSSKGQGQLLL